MLHFLIAIGSLYTYNIIAFIILFCLSLQTCFLFFVKARCSFLELSCNALITITKLDINSEFKSPLKLIFFEVFQLETVKAVN